VRQPSLIGNGAARASARTVTTATKPAENSSQFAV